ncbi:MAG: hypothetical protein AAFX85_13800, partial [Pseudomonadota bacterium]
ALAAPQCRGVTQALECDVAVGVSDERPVTIESAKAVSREGGPDSDDERDFCARIEDVLKDQVLERVGRPPAGKDLVRLRITCQA